MRKWILAVSLASLALATAALAGDPWKEKKPAEWKDTDVRKILTDSPWTRQYDVISTQLQMGGSGSGANGLTGAGNSSAADSGGIGSGGGGRRGRGSSTGDNAEPMRQIVYLAQWYSSRTIRAAQARAAELNGSPVPADSALLKVPQNYQVLLRSADVSQFAKLGEEGLKRSSYLELKSTHQRIAPAKIIVLQGRGRAIAVVYEFPKTTASGEPTLASGEKSIDFVSVGDQLTVKFRFDVSKMVDQQGSDL